MGRSKKHHRYTDEQLTQLATFSTRKELKRFSRLTKHTYQSVYAYWRKITGKRLTDIDPKVKRGAPRKYVSATPKAVKDTVATPQESARNYVLVDNVFSVPIKSVHIAADKDGVQKLVITL